MNLDNLNSEFQKVYPDNKNERRVYFSPGRVNLIGEHTDYNGGYVFPCALSYGTYLVASENNSDTIRFATTNFDFKHEIALDKIEKLPGGERANYPMGVLIEL